MILRITIDVFSGRENPIVELRGKQAQDALERLRPSGSLRKNTERLPPVPTLGYRGLIIEQVGGRAKGLPKVFRYADGVLVADDRFLRATDRTFENFLYESAAMKKLKLGPKFLRLLKKETERFRRTRTLWPWRPFPWPTLFRCRCAPLYEPTWWNVPSRQPYNNCYNYATNYRTDTYAQPGRAAGAPWTTLTCSSVRPAALRDDLIDAPMANNRCPAEGHLVALVVGPGYDYHWYRKGRNGLWTHKPGGGQVTNLDNSGVLIHDPRTADRGPYTDFCTFMVVMHGHIKIN